MVPLLKTTYRIISQARSFVLDLRYDCDQSYYIEVVSRWLFFIHFIRFEMHMDRPDKSDDIFGSNKKIRALYTTNWMSL